MRATGYWGPRRTKTLGQEVAVDVIDRAHLDSWTERLTAFWGSENLASFLASLTIQNDDFMGLQLQAGLHRIFWKKPNQTKPNQTFFENSDSFDPAQLS